jgi:hypothetical protein
MLDETPGENAIVIEHPPFAGSQNWTLGDVQHRQWIIHIDYKISYAGAVARISRAKVDANQTISNWVSNGTRSMAVHPLPLSVGLEDAAELSPARHFPNLPWRDS